MCKRSVRIYASALTRKVEDELTTSRTDYVSATNHKIYQFVAIHGSSGRSVKRPFSKQNLIKIYHVVKEL